MEESTNGNFTNFNHLRKLLNNNPKSDSNQEKTLFKIRPNSDDLPPTLSQVKHSLVPKTGLTETQNIAFNINNKFILDNEKSFSNQKPVLESLPQITSAVINAPMNVNIIINTTNEIKCCHSEDSNRSRSPSSSSKRSDLTTSTHRFNSGNNKNYSSAKSKIKNKNGPNSKKHYRHKKSIQVEQEVLTEVFRIINGTNDHSQEQTKRKELPELNNNIFIHLFREKFIDRRIKEIIANHENFFDNLFKDLYNMIRTFVEQNWKWVDKKKISQITFLMFEKLIDTQFIFTTHFFSKENAASLNRVDLNLEEYRDRFVQTSLFLLLTNRHFEAGVRKEIEECDEQPQKTSEETEKSFQNAISSLERRFLGYRNMISRINDL